MSEPRGLNLGKAQTVSTPAPTQTAAQAPAPSGVQEMKVGGNFAAPALSPQYKPITIAEADEFGKGARMGAASIAKKITGVARAGDIDEVGKNLNNLIVTAKKYDPSNLKKGGGILGFFKVKVQELKNQFATVDQQVDALITEAERNISLFQNRIGDLEALYTDNEARYKELGDVIVEVNRRIAWMEANVPPVDGSDVFSAQRASDWQTAIGYAKQRVDDLVRGQTLCQVQAPQIRQMQVNSGALVQQFRKVKTDMIPALQMGFTLYILNMEQEKGADFSTAVADLTNDTLKKNAEKLGVATVKVQTALARSSIDLSTLQVMQQETIKALDDVQRIRGEMKTRLDQERPQLEALTQQLAQRLSQ